MHPFHLRKLPFYYITLECILDIIFYHFIIFLLNVFWILYFKFFCIGFADNIVSSITVVNIYIYIYIYI
ncbi:hypothetical protein H8356DRAFT_1707486, partial [Neocallimastix lanati (nom. inval.)]